MATNAWTWAALSDPQLSMVSEAEKTLGVNVKYILAFQPGVQAGIMGFSQNGMRISKLDDSQIECLQGLEKKLNSVVIAYQ